MSVTTLCLLGMMLIISLIDSHWRTNRLTDNLQALNRQLELQARFDALTGLANRHQMDLRMQDCLRSAMLSIKQFAVIFLDVDHFKQVNDTWGHHVGDELLITIAQRITARLTREMTLARLGAMLLFFWFQNVMTTNSSPSSQRCSTMCAARFPYAGIR